MSDTVSVREMTADEQLSALEGLLDGTPNSPGPQNAGPEEEADEAEAPSNEAQPETEEVEDEPQETAPIDPPTFWAREAKEHWAAIPRETQEYLARRESDRDAEVRRVQNEAADQRKAAEAFAQQVAQERAYLAQQLAPAIQAVMAKQSEYTPDKMAELARINPAKWAEVVEEQRQDGLRLQQIQAEQARQMEAIRAAEHGKLVSRAPEWADEARFASDGRKIVELAQEFGFSNQEVMQVIDHRALLVLRELATLRAEKSARQALAQKRATQPAPRVLNPATRPDGMVQEARSREATRNIARNGSADDQLAALTRLIDGGALA